MSDIRGEEIAKVIVGVKRAVKAAQENNTSGHVLEVDKLELTLKGLIQKGTGTELTFRIPILDTSLGAKAEAIKQELQTIQLTLVPMEKTTRLSFTQENFEKELVEAIIGIQEGIEVASNGEPRFKLQNASFEMSFVLNNKGEIALLAKGSAQSEIAQTVKLWLRPKPN